MIAINIDLLKGTVPVFHVCIPRAWTIVCAPKCINVCIFYLFKTILKEETIKEVTKYLETRDNVFRGRRGGVAKAAGAEELWSRPREPGA